nr:unnamed protein product [Digitaria exilis]
MAATPEEFFTEALMEPSPLSPSVFLDLTRTADPNTGQLSRDDLVLPCISRMLMEDEIDDKLLCQYSDHPALLQVQQPFAQILSSPSTGANNHDAANEGNTDQANDLLLVSSGDQTHISLAFSDRDSEYVVGEFLKGMEDANRFLPRDNSFVKEHQMDQMFIVSKRKNLEGEVGSRASKIMVRTEVTEEIDIHEMLDGMVKGGHEAFIRDMAKLRIAMDEEAEKKSRIGASKATRDMVDLSALLIRCAQALDTDNYLIAGELLKQIKQHASATGDATQRLAQCFSKGLEVRLMGTGNQLWKLLIAERLSDMEFLKAYNLYMSACCFQKVAQIFSALTIARVMKGKSRLHIVDYGIHCALQWAGLIRWLAKREGGPPPEMKITAVCCSQPTSFPVELIEKQRYRLSKYASELGLPFMFEVIATEWEKVCIGNLNINTDEVLVVSDLFHFSTLKDESVFFDSPNPRDIVLSNIKKMKPAVFIQSILNSSHGCSFLSRFREMLFYYSAMFDMLDAIVPRDSEPRLVLEQDLLGRCALNTIACEGVDLVKRPEKYRQWQSRNQRAGLRQLPLTPVVAKTLKDRVKKHHHKEFLLNEDGHWLLQGWKGRVLFAHSAWVAENLSSQ